jgi:hypothetical protein
MGGMAARMKRQPDCVDNSGVRMWAQENLMCMIWIIFRDEPGRVLLGLLFP